MEKSSAPQPEAKFYVIFLSSACYACNFDYLSHDDTQLLRKWKYMVREFSKTTWNSCGKMSRIWTTTLGTNTACGIFLREPRPDYWELRCCESRNEDHISPGTFIKWTFGRMIMWDQVVSFLKHVRVPCSQDFICCLQKSESGGIKSGLLDPYGTNGMTKLEWFFSS